MDNTKKTTGDFAEWLAGAGSDLAELEELLKLPAVAGKVKLWSMKGERPPKSAVEVVMLCLRKIKAIRHGSEFMQRLWNANQRTFVASSLRSHEMAAFLIEHIPADLLDKATK